MEPPLIFLDFDSSGGAVGTVVVQLAVSGVPSEVADAVLRACHPSNEDDNSSLLHAVVVEVRPHSFVRISRMKRARAGASWEVGEGAGGSGGGQTTTISISQERSSCSLVSDFPDANGSSGGLSGSDVSGVVYFRNRESEELGRVPELSFSAHPCSCVEKDWSFIGKVYKGFGVIRHISSLQEPHPAPPVFSVRDCGLIPPGGELNCGKNVDQYPDSPRDARINFSDVNEVLRVAYGIKSSASSFFREGRFQMAMFYYSKAIKYLNYFAEARNVTREEQNRLLSLIVPCILNSAACRLKLRDYDGALEDCNEAMELAPANGKVYFRRGQAHHGKLNYEQSLYDLYRAQKLCPHDKSINNEIAAVEGEMQVYRKRDWRKNSGGDEPSSSSSSASASASAGFPSRKVSSPFP